jgi:hypothetical protein
MPQEYVTLIGIGIQTALYLLGGYAMVVRNDVKNSSLEMQISKMDKQLESLSEVVTKLAVQDERLNNQGLRINLLDSRIEALRRGDGFIAGARGVEKEY